MDPITIDLVDPAAVALIESSQAMWAKAVEDRDKVIARLRAESAARQETIVELTALLEVLNAKRSGS